METLKLLFTILCGLLLVWILSARWWYYKSTTSRATAPATATTSTTKPVVVRISGIPTSDRKKAEEILRAAVFRKLETGERETLSGSFTVSIVPSCDNPESCDALVDFRAGFSMPKFLSRLQDVPLESVSIPTDEDEPKYLEFDCHFHGFTQLYPTSDDKPATTDIIAITGLDGHAYGSWTSKKEPWRMWLRHFLPEDLPNCRTMIYGYDSKLSENGFANIKQYCDEFLDQVKLVRRAKEAQKRPVIFIAHSFGGILLARSLVKAQQKESDATIVALFRSTHAILFFGVPHYGMVVDDMQKMLGPGHPRQQLLEQISTGENSLHLELDHFINIIEGRRIKSFVEGKQSKALVQEVEGQKWGRTGERITRMLYENAILGLPSWIEEKYTIHEDHSQMVKFATRSGPCKVVLQFLKECQVEAPTVVGKRFSLTTSQNSTYWCVPFQRNPNFIGRQEQLDDLANGLFVDGRFAKMALFGLGGTGKTSVAVEVAYRTREKYPSYSVFWVACASIETFEQSYREIGQVLGLPGMDGKSSDIDVKQRVKNYLSTEKAEHWLMVLDNADDIETWFGKSGGSPRLVDYVPISSNGAALMTTRNKQIAVKFTTTLASSTVLEILEMDAYSSKQLLSNSLIQKSALQDQQSTQQLLEQLCFLPLAIIQTAAYMNENNTCIPEYLSLLNDTEDSLVEILSEEFEDDGRYRDQKNPVVTTWLVSFEQIRRHKPLAANYLSFMSYIDPKAIPQSLLPPAPSTKQRIEAFGCLIAYSFIHKRVDETFDMHRLVHLATQNWLKCIDLFAKHYKIVISQLLEVCPPPVHKNRELWRLYLPHAQQALIIPVEGETGPRSILSMMVGVYLLEEGRYDEAEKRLLESCDTFKRVLGTEDPQTLTCISNLAMTYHRQGRWQEAERLGVEAIGTNIRVLGAEDPSTLVSIGNLAVTYQDQGRWQEAESLELEAIGMKSRILGTEDPSTLASISNLGLTYCGQGRWEEARKLFIEVRDTSRRALGTEHPYTLTIMSNLGSTYCEQGRWEEAEKLFIEVIDTRRRMLGTEHPSILVSMNNLGSIYCKQGRIKEAEKLFIEVIDTSRRVLGTEHPSTLAIMRNLGSTYCQQGRWEEAEKLFIEVIDTSRRVLGAEHPSSLKCIASLAFMLSMQDQWQESEKLLEEAIDMNTKVLGAEHPGTLASMDYLVMTYLGQGQGRLEEARKLLSQVLETRKRVVGLENLATLASINTLATIYIKQKQYEEAEELLLQEIEIGKRVLGLEHPSTLAMMSILAMIYIKQKQYEEAEKLTLQAIEIGKRVLGLEHPFTLARMSNLVEICEEQEQYVDAGELILEVMEIKKRVLGAENPDTLASMDHLVKTYLYQDQGRLEEAEKLLLELVETRKRVLGAEHPDTLLSMVHLAVTYLDQGQDQGRLEEAEKLLLQVIEIRKRVLGAEHPGTLTSMSHLAEAWALLGYDGEVSEFRMSATN